MRSERDGDVVCIYTMSPCAAALVGPEISARPVNTPEYGDVIKTRMLNYAIFAGCAARGGAAACDTSPGDEPRTHLCLPAAQAFPGWFALARRLLRLGCGRADSITRKDRPTAK